MEALPDLAGGPIDLAVVPVWGWGPRLSGGHLSPEDAARAVAMVRARGSPYRCTGGRCIPRGPCTFRRSWFDLPGEWFTGALAEHAPAATSVVLAPGQSWSVPE